MEIDLQDGNYSYSLVCSDENTDVISNYQFVDNIKYLKILSTSLNWHLIFFRCTYSNCANQTEALLIRCNTFRLQVSMSSYVFISENATLNIILNAIALCPCKEMQDINIIPDVGE